jgi:hypothetical protein
MKFSVASKGNDTNGGSPRCTKLGGQLRSNNAFERAVSHRGPRLFAAWPLWPAAQLGR